MLSFAQNSGTDAKTAFQELFSHQSKSLGGKDESSMDQTINVGGFLIDCEVSE